MKLFLKSLATILVIAFVSTPAFAGLVMSTTDRPADGLTGFSGISVFATQSSFGTFTLASSETIVAIEIHGGAFGAAAQGQLIGKVFLTPGHNPSDTADAMVTFHMPVLAMDNVLAQLDTALTGSYFQVIIAAPTPYIGGGLSIGHGPSHQGTTNGGFVNDQLVRGSDQIYIGIYRSDIRPTPEPSTIAAAALGGIALAFLQRKRTR